MKSMVKYRVTTVFLFILSAVMHTGCLARLFTMGGARMTAVRSLAVEGVEVRTMASGLTEVRIAGSATRAARMGITAEEVGLFTRSTAEIKAGRLVAADEAAFNGAMSRIKLVRTPGENPRLFVKNAAEPFAEVLPSEGRIRLFNNNTIRLNNNIFSVEHEILYVRNSPYSSANNIVATLRQGDMVIKLAEENGWYNVVVAQGGAELTGFIQAAFLAPLIIVAANTDEDENETISPERVIKHEAKQRWNHYWNTMDGIQMTAEDALNILYTDFGSKVYNRKISFSANDWPTHVNTFLKMDYDNIPVLSERNFKDTNLRIIGFTKANELLEYVNSVDESVKIHNPLDWGPKEYGQWYQVKTLDGQYGWVFTQPYGQGYITGHIEERIINVQPTVVEQPISAEDKKDEKDGFPVKTILIILGIIIFLALIFKISD